MKNTLPDTLVRFHIHMRRDQLTRLACLADLLAKRKRRDVRLGEALEVALLAGFAWGDTDLLDLTMMDKDAPHWLQLGPVDRLGGKALIPAALRRR